jgi:outer membrane protein OmpA-like peptidoglycan-associated protein
VYTQEDGDDHWLGRKAVVSLLWAVPLLLFCGLLYVSVNGSDDPGAGPTDQGQAGAAAVTSDLTTSTRSESVATTARQPSVATTTMATTTIEPSTPSTQGPASTVVTAGAAPTTTAPGEGDAATGSTVGTSSPPSSQASAAIPPGAPAPGYPTSPDGSPLPLVVVFDVETVTITGQIPSQAAKDRLGALAIANSQFPDVELVDNMVINPAVPISVGVRVIELNSARFPEGSATILPDHALELDRVVAIMQALPNLSVVVVGHADQRGDDIQNFAISDERARAVVNYLLYLGISPSRLSSRAAGETDLITLGDDDAALALNRRTEFILYGLLVE